MGGQLMVATTNPGKLAELNRILAAGHVDVELISLAGLDAPAVRETGATFAANALLKAHAIAEFSGLPTVADDSGLCADALNGMPGVLSARWSGRGATDQSNLQLLLDQLADTPAGRRGAHFACAAALVLPSGREHVAEGRMDGRLLTAPRGTNGFGYDPVFVPDSSELTTAEMTAEAKDAISHRGRALRALAPVIAALLG
jgi:XTP/dITP diphosphohydrolase